MPSQITTLRLLASMLPIAVHFKMVTEKMQAYISEDSAENKSSLLHTITLCSMALQDEGMDPTAIVSESQKLEEDFKILKLMSDRDKEE